MTDTTPRNDSIERPPSLGSDVGQLVRMAGRRPSMKASSVERMREELRPVWEAEVASTARPRQSLRWMAAAAVILLAVATTLLVQNLPGTGAAPFATVARIEGAVSRWSGERTGSADLLADRSVVETGSSVATATAARAALEAATGHSLRLDHDTRVLIVSERELRLEQGGIYIDSGATGRATETLSVLTPFGRVEELGTQYEVRLRADTLTVRVREGEVSISGPNEAERAVAGEALVFSGGSVERSSLEPDDPVFDWTQRIAPAWRLDGSRLGAFLAWAAREGGLSLRYADGASAQGVEDVALSGEVEGLSPREALDAVLPAVGLDYRIEDSTLVITRRARPTDSGS